MLEGAQCTRLRDNFRRLEASGNAESGGNTDLWSLHYALMDVARQEIEVFKRHCDQRPLSTEGHKISYNLWISRNFNNQTIERQTMPPTSVHGPIINPTFRIELAMDKTTHTLH